MRRDTFAKYSLAVLAYNLLVIVWGAYVRATGSGAGCGSHWPLCNGEVVPHAPSTARMIEFSHRVSSGIALVLVLIMAVGSFIARSKGDPTRRLAVWSFILIANEALIGAGLVLFELVAHDASLKRALSMTLHLTNTFVLLAVLTLAVRAAFGAPSLRFSRQGIMPLAIAVVVGTTLILGMSGAVTALGDTLFPAKSITEGFSQDFSRTAHLFVRLRGLHPVIATLTGAAILAFTTVAPMFWQNEQVVRQSRWVLGLFGFQFVLGLVNVALLAPVWMQLLHLLSADAVWIALILFSAAILSSERTRGDLKTEGAPYRGY